MATRSLVALMLSGMAGVVLMVSVLAGPANGSPQPSFDPGVVGDILSGGGTNMTAPTGPSAYPYSPNCHTLIDAGFTGTCVVANSSAGTVAGIVEQETAALSSARASSTPADVQERDLVWHRDGNHWTLALRWLFYNTGIPSLLWADDIARNGSSELIFVTPTDRAGFGHDLDVVAGSGRVTLYRFLGQGFANVPAAGGLVTYVPGWTEQNGPFSAYDQVLIGYSDRSWQVFSEQYVPLAAALRQHHGVFSDSHAVPAS
jgi:hypothetical protein